MAEVLREIIGVIPAAGQANRLGPLPCSKEIYPVGFGKITADGEPRPKAGCHYLLERMRLAGITKVYIVLRPGKWDIPAYLGDGTAFDLHLAYLMMGLPFGVPYTLDQAFPFVQDALVVLGFPDILFQPDDAYVHLLERQITTDADLVLGLFQPDQPQKWDMVDLTPDGRIHRLVIKPSQTELRYSWGVAVWTPVFTRFMHQYLSALQAARTQDAQPDRELYVGDVIQAAIHEGLRIENVLFPEGVCLDIGTPAGLIRAVRAHMPGEKER